jgi:hypothetical protein
MHVSPLAYAIMVRSLTKIDIVISQDPKAPLEMLRRYTALQLCDSWPQGLQRLLDIEARSTSVMVLRPFDSGGWQGASMKIWSVYHGYTSKDFLIRNQGICGVCGSAYIRLVGITLPLHFI